MAARIEFEGEWLHKFKDKKQKEDTSQIGSPKQTIKNKALKSVGSSGLKNILDTL